LNHAQRIAIVLKKFPRMEISQNDPDIQSVFRRNRTVDE
jgi:hypothetical protein